MFYKNLFGIAPELRTTLFKNVDMDTQSDKLMKMIDAAVGLLESPDTLVPVLLASGERHAGFGCEDAHYAVVGAAFMATCVKGSVPI